MEHYPVGSRTNALSGFDEEPEDWPAPPVPQCLKVLGFTEMPASVEEVRARRRKIILEHHPDKGGDARVFQRLLDAAEEAEALVAEFRTASSR